MLIWHVCRMYGCSVLFFGTVMVARKRGGRRKGSRNVAGSLLYRVVSTWTSRGISARTHWRTALSQSVCVCVCVCLCTRAVEIRVGAYCALRDDGHHEGTGARDAKELCLLHGSSGRCGRSGCFFISCMQACGEAHARASLVTCVPCYVRGCLGRPRLADAGLFVWVLVM
jgi:hypothetical protein